MFNTENFLKTRGIKPTPNRIMVLNELANATHPLCLAELVSLLDYSVDKTSIFRTLEIFAEKEVVHVIEDGSRSLKYELCQSDGCHSIADQHVHFYCEKCRATYCFEAVKIPVVDIPDGFSPRSVNYMIKGLCPDCSKK